MTIHIGTSGWSYDHWQGVLYPHAVPVGDRLSFYLQHFTTVEVNSSHYHWPRDATFIRWRNLIPDHFLMTVKAPRGLTHAARLFAPERWVARIERGLACLGSKRGVLLVQLPPQFAYDHARLDYFLRTLPADLKVAVELRHSSWHCQSVFEMLEQRGAAYCVMSGAHLPCMLRATTSFVYVRLHGPDREHLYGGLYLEYDLQWWADRIREWDQLRRDVFVYFNNDGGGNAVRNAARLKQILTL